MFETAERVPVTIFGDTESTPPPYPKGVEVRRMPAGADGRLSLAVVLESLAAEGVTRVLVEGGPTIAGAILAADLVDEVVIGHGTEALGVQGSQARRRPWPGVSGRDRALADGRRAHDRRRSAHRAPPHRPLCSERGGMSQRFRYYVRVRYQECDAQHVVFNARYGDYIDLACFEFLRAALPRPTDIFDGTFEIQTVRQAIEWKAPARFDDVLEISVWTSRLGTTSFTLSFELRRAGEADALVTSETVYVHVDPKTFTKREIAPQMRAALEAGAAGKAVDHAGYLPRRLGARRGLLRRVHHLALRLLRAPRRSCRARACRRPGSPPPPAGRSVLFLRSDTILRSALTSKPTALASRYLSRMSPASAFFSSSSRSICSTSWRSCFCAET